MGSTQVSPIAPQAISMRQPMPQTVRSNPMDLPHMYTGGSPGGPRGWKKISPKDGDSDETSSDPTPAEALQFARPQK